MTRQPAPDLRTGSLVMVGREYWLAKIRAQETR